MKTKTASLMIALNSLSLLGLREVATKVAAILSCDTSSTVVAPTDEAAMAEFVRDYCACLEERSRLAPRPAKRAWDALFAMVVYADAA